MKSTSAWNSCNELKFFLFIFELNCMTSWWKFKKKLWINPASTENYKQDGYIVLSENGKIVSDITTNG